MDMVREDVKLPIWTTQTLFLTDVHAIKEYPAEGIDGCYKTETSALHQVVKQQLKHLTTVRLIQTDLGAPSIPRGTDGT
jgi:hypothetical protein